MQARCLFTIVVVATLLGPWLPARAVESSTTAAAASSSSPAASSATELPRYTFSWPLGEGSLKPRGGTTRGVPVTPDKQPSAAWQALQATGLTPKERDRRAILAMAGTYRVTFDFLEVATFGEGPRAAPYQSWGTEKVYIDRDEPGAISLVHILEMRILDKAGKPSEPFVTKHWRQDWRHEPTSLLEYQGGELWRVRGLADAERQGAWVQAVYQVDESPRYAAVGRWQHNPSFSTWISSDTARPLPRREWSVRRDYQMLVGTNRHTVGPTGWTQEENNLKAVLTAQREVDASRPYAGREYGIARYERLRDADFAAADRYYERTRAFWDQVRGAWADIFLQRSGVVLRGQVDQLGLFVPLFERADQINEGTPATIDSNAALIRKVLVDMGAPAPGTPARSSLDAQSPAKL